MVAGSETIIGAAIGRRLRAKGVASVVLAESKQFRSADVAEGMLARSSPEYVFLAAGKSGGIDANRNYPAELMIDNLLIECHALEAARRGGVSKLLYLASSCCYPKHAPQPMQVQSLFAGRLEPTNEAYAVAKLAGITMCQAYHVQYGSRFISAIPTNTFGPDDHFSAQDSHVIGALIRRLDEAKHTGARMVNLWGTGTPRREFLYSEDVADACMFLMENYEGVDPVNIGGGTELSIAELATAIADVVHYTGEIRFDASRPDGMPLKALDSSELQSMGWNPTTRFADAVRATYEEYVFRSQRNAP
jgi:GDP-L-fucose synthase